MQSNLTQPVNFEPAPVAADRPVIEMALERLALVGGGEGLVVNL